MEHNEKYFISLIKSHLNCTAPEVPDNVDWKEIYNLSAINNITAIIASEVQKLGKEHRPDNDTLSAFRQQLGYTLIDFEEKEKAVKAIGELLNRNKIEYIFVKGAIIKKYYPVRELRTSADTDIIIRHNELEKLKAIAEKAEISIGTRNTSGFTINIFNQNIEIHGTNDYDNEYFRDIFDICSKGKYECVLDNYNHLLYVLCHIIKHMNHCGAGIKMFMDIDVLIRNTDDFDYEKMFAM